MWLAFVSWAAAHELKVPFDPPGDSCAVRSAVDDCNLIHLTAMDNNRGLLHKRQINCTHWTSWLELGGQFAGGPALVKNSRGQIELYVRGIDKRMCVPLHHVASPHFLTHMPVPKSGTEECITRRARAARAGLIRGRVNGRVQSGSSPRSDPSRTSRRRIRSFLRVRRTRGSSASTCR